MPFFFWKYVIGTVIDGTGLYALPGLIDCHSHPFLADTNLARLNEVSPTLITHTVLEEAGRKNGWSESMLDKLKMVKEAGFKSLEICRTAGVQIGLGTDLLGNSFDHQSREFTVRSEVESVRAAI